MGTLSNELDSSSAIGFIPTHLGQPYMVSIGVGMVMFGIGAERD